MPFAFVAARRVSLATAFLLCTGFAVGQPSSSTSTEEEKNPEETAANLDGLQVTGTLGRFSALKSDTPIMETARSVSIETSQEWQNQGALELSETYLYSAGVFGQVYGFATRGDWVFVRGLDVPEYRDSLQALFGNYNNTRPHLYTLEQVEVLKGPASVLYGQGSPGGLVNVVSKTPRADLTPEVFVQAGTDNYMQVGADFGGALNADASVMYRVVAVGRDADTMVDFVNDDTVVVAPSITFAPSDFTEITILGNFQDTDSKAGAQFLPIAGTLTPAANGRFIDHSAFMGEPGFDYYDTNTDSVTVLASHMFNATWSMEVTGRWTQGEADYQQAWTAFIGGDRYVYNDDGSLYRDGMLPRTFYRANSSSDQKAVDMRLRADFTAGTISHEVMMGVQYQDVTTETDSAYAFALGYDFATGGPDALFGDTYWINVFNPQYGNIPGDDILDLFYSDSPESNTRDLGLYINDQMHIGNWRLTAGLRYDDVDTDTGTAQQKDYALSYSVGALYQFANGVSPYASYAESFEPVIGADAITNQPLKPQEGQQFEIGLKYQPPGKPIQITAAWFDLEQSNLSNPNGLPNAPSQQEGIAKVQGLEVEAKARLGAYFVEANLTHLDTENANGFTFASTPERQASVWLGYEATRTQKGFRAGLGIRHIGDTYDGVDVTRTPSYTLGDAMLGYGWDHWDVSLNARNLTDKEYLATCLARGDCFEGERRSVFATARYRF